MDADHITTSTRDPQELAARLRAVARPTRLGAGERAGHQRGVQPGEQRDVVGDAPVHRGLERGRHHGDPRLVARIEPPATDYPVFTTYDLDMQFRVMRLVREQTDGARCPRPSGTSRTRRCSGGPFFVMDRVDGLVPPDVLPYTFGDNWVFDASDADRRTHPGVGHRGHGRHPCHHPGRSRPRASSSSTSPGASSLERSLNHWRAYHEWVVRDAPSPLLADCFAWLADNLPDRRERRRAVLG